uniref:Uncharacterized protein n=1 Tax=Trichobilharzia regenti TaxID=157069 RepID=A0AA85J4W7_TRIRE|nr:unnamed protein product [Trichobilharzia regenti]
MVPYDSSKVHSFTKFHQNQKVTYFSTTWCIYYDTLHSVNSSIWVIFSHSFTCQVDISQCCLQYSECEYLS